MSRSLRTSRDFSPLEDPCRFVDYITWIPDFTSLICHHRFSLSSFLDQKSVSLRFSPSRSLFIAAANSFDLHLQILSRSGPPKILFYAVSPPSALFFRNDYVWMARINAIRRLSLRLPFYSPFSDDFAPCFALPSLGYIALICL